jgi:hypothetical protein
MHVAFVDRDHVKVKRADALQAGGIDAVLVGIRPALVVRVNAAFRAEVVLGLEGVELVERQRILPGGDVDVR